ncbi:MAG TPA: gluconokinase [Actinomycetaceae bacterium]|nr:gluconokinase [Actinomycetaceae bacterium]
MADAHPRHVVFMGVSGSGKTTLARLVSERLGWPIAEADDFHPAANIDKMRSGIALTDEDRWPWLRAIRDWMAQQSEAGRSTVVACSALRRVYRDVLREAGDSVSFVLLEGDFDTLEARLLARKGHFMGATLLNSQLDTLEALDDDEDGVTLDADETPERLVAETMSALGLSGTRA